MFSLFSFQLGKENERDRESRLWFFDATRERRLFLSTKQKAMAMAVSENFTGSMDNEKRAAKST